MSTDPEVPPVPLPVAVSELVWVGRSMPPQGTGPCWGVLGSGWDPRQAADKVADGWSVVCPDFDFAAEVLRRLGADEGTVERRVGAAMSGVLHHG